MRAESVDALGGERAAKAARDDQARVKPLYSGRPMKLRSKRPELGEDLTDLIAKRRIFLGTSW